MPDQPSASPRALPNVSPDRTFPPTEARPPQTSADEQMQSTFGTKLSLDDLLGGANGSGGEPSQETHAFVTTFFSCC